MKFAVLKCLLVDPPREILAEDCLENACLISLLLMLQQFHTDDIFLTVKFAGLQGNMGHYSKGYCQWEISNF